MHFDTNISVGNILTALVLFAGFWHAHSQNIKRLERIEAKVDLMFHWFERTIIRRGE